MKHGQGTYTWSHGKEYVGEFKNGEKHGQGTETYPSGNKYVGEFKNGIPNGQGRKTTKDGDYFAGEFKDGNGWTGTVIDRYGQIITKIVNGQPVKQ